MGISDYLWPFERKFIDIPGAREAGIAALLGGPTVGALAITIGRPRHAFKATTYSGFVIFWISFIYNRTLHTAVKAQQEQFIQAYKAGKIE